jgi:hypothetical protein
MVYRRILNGDQLPRTSSFPHSGDQQVQFPGNEASPDGDVDVKKGYIVYLHYGHWQLRSPGMQPVSEYLAYHHNLTIVDLDVDVDNQYIAISALQTMTILAPLGCNL